MEIDGWNKQCIDPDEGRGRPEINSNDLLSREERTIWRAELGFVHQQEEAKIPNARKRNLSTQELKGTTFGDAVKILDRAGKTRCADNGESPNPTLQTAIEVECFI
ncbi:hypothetical protein AAC387_Pa06g2103 [Persea americana]